MISNILTFKVLIDLSHLNITYKRCSRRLLEFLVLNILLAWQVPGSARLNHQSWGSGKFLERQTRWPGGTHTPSWRLYPGKGWEWVNAAWPGAGAAYLVCSGSRASWLGRAPSGFGSPGTPASWPASPRSPWGGPEPPGGWEPRGPERSGSLEITCPTCSWLGSRGRAALRAGNRWAAHPAGRAPRSQQVV